MATTLLFGVHAHQPAGNFTAVLDAARARCYRPFLETLYRYPDFRFAVHISGPLLDYLLAHYPDDMLLLRAMVERGQVELFGAGETEPVLAAIPHRDRVGQIRALSAKLQRTFGAAPAGVWLTERVWESAVVPALVECVIRYVTVDDYHFLCAGKTVSALDGYFTTEESGARLDLYPILEGLRYRIPFAPAEESVAYVAQLDATAVYFDDIEKFGIWPETYEWVYGKKWLEKFIQGVLSSPAIQTTSFWSHHARSPSRGIVYLPTASYVEMNEWTLPAPAAEIYADLVARERQAKRYEIERPFIRGGIWRNFLSRYAEANWMHKRMLALSERLAVVPADAQSAEATHQLYLAQANDAYWHGLFGGLYLPHLRRGVWNALLRLEAELDRIAPRPPRGRWDVDADGVDELFIQNGELQAVLKLDGSASIIELDAYAFAHNFGDTLRRHPEHYHRNVLAPQSSGQVASGIASAHDRVRFKHPIAPDDLTPDRHAPTLFRDWWVDGEPQALSAYELGPYGAPEHAASFRGRCMSGRAEKLLSLQGTLLTVSWLLDDVPRGIFRTELNLALPSCDGPAGRYILCGEVKGGFGQPLEAADVTEIVLEDEFMGGAVSVQASRPATMHCQPYMTVSQSEDGYEKIMQCATIALSWPIAAGTHALSVALQVSRLDTAGTFRTVTPSEKAQ